MRHVVEVTRSSDKQKVCVNLDHIVCFWREPGAVPNRAGTCITFASAHLPMVVDEPIETIIRWMKNA